MRLLPVLALAAGCTLTSSGAPDAPRDIVTSRAALATLVVDNQTAHILDIGYYYIESGGGSVIVGSIASATRDTLAHVPAREPIILFARNPAGSEYRDITRALELDSIFLWRIPGDAHFTVRTP